MKASLFRRVHAWAGTTPEDRVRFYLSTVQSKLEDLQSSQAMMLRWSFFLIFAFELLLASSVSSVSVGPIEVTNLRLVTLLMPAAISFCMGGVIGIGAVHRLLVVTEAACIRALYHVEWMLGIDMPLHDTASLQDHHLESWGRPAKRPWVQRAHGAVLWLYLQLFGLLFLLYAPIAALRAGAALGFDSVAFWIATILTTLGLIRSLLAHSFADGAWDLDEDLPPLAHLMSDADVARWQEMMEQLKESPDASNPGRGGEA